MACCVDSSAYPPKGGLWYNKNVHHPSKNFLLFYLFLAFFGVFMSVTHAATITVDPNHFSDQATTNIIYSACVGAPPGGIGLNLYGPNDTGAYINTGNIDCGSLPETISFAGSDISSVITDRGTYYVVLFSQDGSPAADVCNNGESFENCSAAVAADPDFYAYNFTYQNPTPAGVIPLPSGFTPALSANISDQVNDNGTLALIGVVAGIPLAFYVMHELIALMDQRRRNHEGSLAKIKDLNDRIYH